MPLKFDFEFVTHCCVIREFRVQEIRLGNGLPDRQCYKSCGCDKHLCSYMAAPPPRSHRSVGYGRRCLTRPLRVRPRMLFGCRIPVARRCFWGIWVKNYGCEMGKRELDATTRRLRRRHHLSFSGADHAGLAAASEQNVMPRGQGGAANRSARCWVRDSTR
jgi:hypothetical protein